MRLRFLPQARMWRRFTCHVCLLAVGLLAACAPTGNVLMAGTAMPAAPALPTPFPSPTPSWPVASPPPPTPVLTSMAGSMLPGPAVPWTITNVAETTDGTVWFATGDNSFHGAGGGIYHFDGNQVVHITTLPGWSSSPSEGDNVLALAAAPDGSLWAGAGCRVLRNRGQEWRALTTDCSVLKGDAVDFAFTPDGVTWVASVFTVASIRGDEVSAEDRLVHSLAVTSDGALWAAGWEGLQDSHYLARYDGRAWVTYPMVPLLRGGMGRLTADRDGAIWGTAELGLYRVRLNGTGSLSATRYESLDGLPGQRSGRVVLAPDGTPWVVAAGALAYFDGRAWHAAGRAGDETASALAVGRDGVLWVGTAEGHVWRLTYDRGTH